MKTITFFQTNFQIGFGKFATYWLPYAVAKLWSMCRTDPLIASKWVAGDFIFERINPQQLIETMERPDVAAFSCYVWNWNWNLEMAREIKRRWPDVTVVMGGPQVPERAERLEELYAEHGDVIDYTFHGEAELSLIAFLKWMTGDNDALPNGVTYKDYYENTQGERVVDLDTTPSPFLDGVMDQIVAQHPDKNFSVTLETNRGCPYACTFCDWGSLTFNKIKKFNEQRVCQEIDWIAHNGIKFVDVSDANFGILKQRDFDLLKHMIKKKNETGYPESYSFNWQKHSTDLTLEMIRYLTDNNSARGFTVSAQSMDDGVLTNIKRKNLGISNFQHIFQKCNVENIQTYTELILGLPGETQESWITGVNDLLEYGQHNNIEVWFCQLLENAELNSREQRERYNIKHSYIYNYISGPKQEEIPEGIGIVKSTDTMTFDELVECYLYSWMITNFHSFGWTQIVSRYLRETQQLPFRQFYDDLYTWIRQDDYFSSLVNEVETFIRNSFETGFFEGRGIHYYLAAYQQKFHQDRDTVWHKLDDYLSQYDLEQDVRAFQKAYVTDIDRMNESFEFKSSQPIWQIINQIEYQTQDEYSYQFDVYEIAGSREEYLDSFYFRRRKGWGKHRVEIIQ